MYTTPSGRLAFVEDLPTYSVVQDTDTLPDGNTVSKLTPTGAPSQMGILYFHPLGGDGTEVFDDLVCGILARWGFPVAGSTMGGLTAWNNDLMVSHADDTAAYLVSDMGAVAGQFGLYNISMGATSSLKWASMNLGSVVVWASLAGCVSMDYFYDTQSQLTIDGAFAGQGGWPANAATHDPQLLAEAGLLAGLHGKIWHGSTDTVIGAPTTVDAFTAEVPTVQDRQYTNGAGGHFDIVYLSALEIASFVARSYAPTAAYFHVAT